jgi:two-component system, OmpR family, phosphate regulon sensor histidine kinase PhoR
VGRIAKSFKTIRQALNVIPKEYSDEINNKVINKNINRIGILSKVLAFMNVLMIIVDLTVYYPKWSINSGYINLFYAHCLMLIERSLYILGIYILQVKRVNCFNKLKKFFVFYTCIVTLLWCSYLSINAQALHGQISAYIIGSFSIASLVLLFPTLSLTIFTLNTTFFVIMLYFTPVVDGDFTSNVINALFVVAFTFLMSYINITLYSKDYINKKTIQMQSLEIAISRNKLEETVRRRTEDLVSANKQLVKEMGIRHEIEVQSLKTKFMYEENTVLLSKIKEYEELRNVFFANLSHELRTPLNVIFSAQQMMDFIISKQSCEDCKHQISKYNKIVKQNCYRLIRLIGNLIDITKIDAKYFEVNKKNCDIVSIVGSITQSVSDYIKDKHIELLFSSELEKRVIAFDPDKVERIMLNLLSNAVKFTAKKGQINVKIKLVDGYVAISVIDNGIGISKEMQGTIFERFIQADKSITRNREGSGIGLSLVKSLVDLHQGRISLTSEQGKGSEFVVMLPDETLPLEDSVACTYDSNDQDNDIERINIEFSDIYS